MSDRIKLWPIHEIAMPNIKLLRDNSGRAYMMNGYRILVTHDPQGDGTKLWHLSISARDHDPPWEAIVTARYRLLPEVPEMAMYLPPIDEYVNIHPFTFHLHEVLR